MSAWVKEYKVLSRPDGHRKRVPNWPARLAELIKLIVQVLDDVLRLNRGKFLFGHDDYSRLTAFAAHPKTQRARSLRV